ncbi:MAG: hypothetical protein HQM06_07850 [Magnetococcales bacterium]|nr:hypothetical protein [Magnetococcales bacterium]
MDNRIAASQEISASVNRDTFYLVWATIDWAIRAERFHLTAASIAEFRAIPHEVQEKDGTLHQLDVWMENHLRPETRQRIFSEIRRAQFEAAKGAAQITIADETYRLLRQRKKALFGPFRGSMETTIRHLLLCEQRALPNQAYRLLEQFRQRQGISSLTEAVRLLIDQAEMASQTQPMVAEPLMPTLTPPVESSTPILPPLPTSLQNQTPLPVATCEPGIENNIGSMPLSHPMEPVWNALLRYWIPG